MPIVIVQVGLMAMGVVDAIMVGRYSAEALAATAIGNFYFFVVAVFGMGVLLGWALSFVIYQVKPYDPITLGAATGLLALSSIVASMVPARRAANVLPMTALRND